MRKKWGLLLSIFCCCILAACSSETHFAPVAEINTIERIPHSGEYRVKSGETLYSIAWRYGMDYRALAKLNQIAPPYAIHAGEILILRRSNLFSAKKVTLQQKIPTQPIAHPITQTKVHSSAARPPAHLGVAAEPTYRGFKWQWPVKGRVIASFAQFNKGINIAGVVGEPVCAAAPGKIVYAGDGLRGYGKLIIVKHNSTDLSAYAFNRLLLVHEGDWVKQGQKIAEMGVFNGKPLLHFEIRKAGQPVNPRKYLS